MGDTAWLDKVPEEVKKAQIDLVKKCGLPEEYGDLYTMLARLPDSKDFPGWLEVNTFHGGVEGIAPECQELYKPIPSWQYIDVLQKTTCPLEKYLTKKELKKLKDKDLVSYHKTMEYWTTIWFVQCFRHWHQEVRTSELHGPKENQNFWRAPPLSVPIRCNVLTFDWKNFCDTHRAFSGGEMFDIIVTDPPWTLATEKSTRGVALNYDQITDVKLMKAVPFDKLLNENGVIFMWVINAKMIWACEWLESIGCEIVDVMSWLKMSTNRLMARGHGYYLQHAKEDCIVAVKGDVTHYNWEKLVCSMVAEKRCQSQKPSDFYDMVEQFAPGKRYCEVFGRRNNLRNGWITIGNQL